MNFWLARWIEEFAAATPDERARAIEQARHQTFTEAPDSSALPVAAGLACAMAAVVVITSAALLLNLPLAPAIAVAGGLGAAAALALHRFLLARLIAARVRQALRCAG